MHNQATKIFLNFFLKGAVKKEASENKCSDLQKRERCICFCDMIKLQ